MEKGWLTNNSPTRVLRRILPLKQSRPDIIRVRVAQTGPSRHSNFPTKWVLIHACSIQTPSRAVPEHPHQLPGCGLLGLLSPGTIGAVTKARTTECVSLVVQDPRSPYQYLLGPTAKAPAHFMGKSTGVPRSREPYGFREWGTPAPADAVWNTLEDPFPCGARQVS